MKQRRSPAELMLIGLLIFNMLSVLLPLLLALMSSVKSTREIWNAPFALPSVFSLENYQKVLESGDFLMYFRNSVIVTGSSLLLILLLGSLAGYALGRFSFRWNNLVYVCFLVGLIFPAKLALVPLFIQLRSMNLLDSHLGIILVYAAGATPAAVFMMTGFFRSLPADLDNAARIDGASEFQVFWKVMLPLVRPQLGIVGIYTTIPIWNDFLLPLVFLKSDQLKTVPQGLSLFFGEYGIDWGPLFAGLTIAALPIVLLYLVLSEQFIKGMTAGAVKG